MSDVILIISLVTIATDLRETGPILSPVLKRIEKGET